MDYFQYDHGLQKLNVLVFSITGSTLKSLVSNLKQYIKADIRPVETGRAVGGIFAKVDLLAIDNDSDKKKNSKRVQTSLNSTKNYW